MRWDMKAWCSSSGNYHRHKEEEEEVGMGVEFAVLLMATSCSHFHMNSALCSYLRQSVRLISCSCCPLNCLNLFFPVLRKEMWYVHRVMQAPLTSRVQELHNRKLPNRNLTSHIFTFLSWKPESLKAVHPLNLPPPNSSHRDCPRVWKTCQCAASSEVLQQCNIPCKIKCKTLFINFVDKVSPFKRHKFTCCIARQCHSFLEKENPVWQQEQIQ